MKYVLGCLLWVLIAPLAFGQWRLVAEHDSRQNLPQSFAANGQAIKVGDEVPQNGRFRWLLADISIPPSIEGQPTAGKSVGLQFSCGDGGEMYVGGRLCGRYDNDHPLLAVLTESAAPGQSVSLAVQVYAGVQGGPKLDESTLVLLPGDRVKPAELSVDADSDAGPVPKGLIGLSQGGGLSDYEDATAAKLKQAGFQWFRTDNVLTQSLKRDGNDRLVHDWTALDERVDFIHKTGAEPILAVSYMPQVLDAVPNNDRQSAPADYDVWEDLCYQAARRCIERGKRVPFWEVWNEVNTGWLKPGPQDKGGEEFRELYRTAIGRDEPDLEVVRRFEAYAKLYRATARGIRRADPEAKIGGPALASGPFESDQYPHCQHGKGFARGLMLWCQQEKLPLDFVSWHEYFHPADVIATQAKAFRDYLRDFPPLEQSVKHLMVTEWNEAWWPDRPHDHEIGAAWCADGMIRAMIPARVDRPCLFYVKQGDSGFRGDWSILMAGNQPKPTYNVARMFNSLSGHWLNVRGGDNDIAGVAALDENRRRLAIVLVNYRFRHPVQRKVRLRVDKLPAALVGGQWREWLIDPLHANVFTDASRSELEVTAEGDVRDGSFVYERDLLPNSVVMVELNSKATE